MQELARLEQRLGKRIDEVDERLGRRLEQFAAESKAADERVGQRVESMVSGIGEQIREK